MPENILNIELKRKNCVFKRLVLEYTIFLNKKKYLEKDERNRTWHIKKTTCIEWQQTAKQMNF